MIFDNFVYYKLKLRKNECAKIFKIIQKATCTKCKLPFVKIYDKGENDELICESYIVLRFSASVLLGTSISDYTYIIMYARSVVKRLHPVFKKFLFYFFLIPRGWLLPVIYVLLREG